MSLCTDKIFFRILRDDADVSAAVGSALFNTADTRTEREETRLPYIVITNDGTVQDADTKDTPYEGEEDIDSIGIVVCAESRRQLADVAQMVRRALRDGLMAYRPEAARDEDDVCVVGYDFSADGVMYDSEKPCYWQALKYNLTTTYNYGNY